LPSGQFCSQPFVSFRRVSLASSEHKLSNYALNAFSKESMLSVLY